MKCTSTFDVINVFVTLLGEGNMVKLIRTCYKCFPWLWNLEALNQWQHVLAFRLKISLLNSQVDKHFKPLLHLQL